MCRISSDEEVETSSSPSPGVVTVGFVVAAFAVCPGAFGQSADFFEDVRVLLDTVRTATWVQTSWEKLAGREEHTSAHCIWSGQDNMRLDVFDGRGSGATAILFDDKVFGFKRGLLSFVKRSFEPTHPRVLSLRGNTMRENGFMDDLRYVLEIRDRVTVAPDTTTRTGLIVSYRDMDGLSAVLHLRRDPLRVGLHERVDGGEVVERYTYTEVRYNPTVDVSRLRP